MLVNISEREVPILTHSDRSVKKFLNQGFKKPDTQVFLTCSKAFRDTLNQMLHLDRCKQRRLVYQYPSSEPEVTEIRSVERNRRPVLN